MAFWRRLSSFISGAGNRQEGLQLGEPSYYTTPASTPVTLDSSLQLSSVWACARLISESVSSLPINVYKIDKNGVRTLDTKNPLHSLFSGKVNRWQTKNEFFETMTYQLVLLGNAYAAVQRNSRNEIIALVPLMSEQMEVDLADDGKINYRYTSGREVKFYAQDTIWHNKLFGNGIIGLSPLAYARNSIGVAQGAETAVSKIYNNGGKPSGLLTIDKAITKEQRAQIKSNFAELAEGNTSRLFVLEAGMNYQQVSLSPQDIELLSSRRFQIEDIARFFGVPSVLINDTASNTTWGSGIQQIVQGFYKLGLRPYLERYEASMKAWLLTPEQRLTTDIEFDFNALLRPDLADRIKAGKEAVQGGLMTPNEYRLTEGWQPVTGGDVAYMQQQMIPLGTAPIMTGVQNEKNNV